MTTRNMTLCTITQDTRRKRQKTQAIVL